MEWIKRRSKSKRLFILNQVDPIPARQLYRPQLQNPEFLLLNLFPTAPRL